MDLPDIQNTEPMIKRPVYQVGVENVTVPFTLESKYNGFRAMTADVSMRTDLSAEVKGISMSRLIRTLKQYLDLPLKQVLIKEILQQLVWNVGATRAFIKFSFHLPVTRTSASTDNHFPIYHKCRFEGQLTEDLAFKFFQGVVVQYASYCPCSAELSRDLVSKGLMGFPHAQRSFAHLLIEGDGTHYIWLEDLIESVERSIKTIPYPIIKREDEQEIARIAAENPLFVEDAIRAISQELDNMEGIHDWIVKCVHEESIHTSEAIAINYKGVDSGFDERYYI